MHNTPEGHHGRSHTCQVWADHPTFQKLPQPSPEESRWEAPGNVRLLSSVHETASSRATSFWSPGLQGSKPDPAQLRGRGSRCGAHRAAWGRGVLGAMVQQCFREKPYSCTYMFVFFFSLQVLWGGDF